MNIFYPEELPITSRKNDIIDAIRDNQVIIVAGDTGSGKTTQIAKMCLEALPENKLFIGCTQPRRIAASTVAHRVGEELGDASSLVGYKIRFHDHTTKKTKIKFMTDGVLLAETKSDRALSRYGVLIIDEAHERSLNIDFLLGYLKRLVIKRPDLKIIITSATIDTKAFSQHFDNAPILTIAGRTYPVTIKYHPVAEDQLEMKDGMIDHCVQTAVDLFATEPGGDILIFLPTERDIRECCSLLEKRLNNAVVLPMFGRLQTGDQKKIFQSFKQIKIVVATNVAETSITVPGIRYVIDSGLARISRYNVRAKTTSLPISKISRASCDQRKGRCGRIGPGLCIRLYAEEDYDNRAEFTLPELQRSNLAEVILQMISLKLGDPEDFPFLDMPHGNAIREGYRLLRELGAVNSDISLTKYGKIMADLPIDPCISRIIIAAQEYNCLREIKIIASVLAIQDPRIRPAEKENQADLAHKQFAHPHSDFLALLNIWEHFHQLHEKSRSWSKLKKYCKTHFLSFQRMREWFDLHEQLDRILSKRENFTDNTATPSYEQIHKSLLPGFLRNIALKKQQKIYQGSYNKELMVFPGSHQFSKSGQWIVAATFIETNRLYALTVATIEPEWVESVADNLCKYSWANPRWHKKSGQVIATETVHLFGLQILTGKKVNYGKRHQKNVPEARDIFIQAALVEGELKGTYHFLQHNLALVKTWEEAEHKLRTRGIVADNLILHNFYSTKISTETYDQRGLNLFLKREKNKQVLQMTESDILARKPGEIELSDYPPTFSLGSLDIDLEYNFTPGSNEDGVTFKIPIDYAHGVSPQLFEWLVPGLLHEKLTFLLKGLPKNVRKKLVPVSNTVNQILDDISLYSGSLSGAIESSILKQFKILIRRSDWPSDLPLHLRPRFVLFDSSGNECGIGRDLKKLLSAQEHPAVDINQSIIDEKDEKTISHWKERKFTTWEFNDLPASIPLFTKTGTPSGFLFPTLVPYPDQGCVKIEFEKNRQKADDIIPSGMLYLYRMQLSNQYKSLKKLCSTNLSGPSALWLLEKGQNRQQTIDQILNFILRSVIGHHYKTIGTGQQFKQNVDKIKRDGLYKTGSLICNDIFALLRKRKTVREAIVKVFSVSQGKNRQAIEKNDFFDQLVDDILGSNFLTVHNHSHLIVLDRQLQSLLIRVERYANNPLKDASKEKQLLPHLTNMQNIEKNYAELSTEAKLLCSKYREMIAEFRISIFSPEIKTSFPVSSKKLQQQWRAISER